MNGIQIGVNPVIFELGHLMVRWYSVLLALAVVAGVWLGVREAKRKGILASKLEGLVWWSVGGGIAGARLFHVVDRWDLYANNPLSALAIWNGGLAVYGGLIGGAVAGAAYVWRNGLPLGLTADAAAPGMLLGQALGRFACIPNGDAYGAPANLPWSFIYVRADVMVPPSLRGVPLHPYAVYEIVFDLGLLAGLWLVRDRVPFLRHPGLLFLAYAASYSAGRFLLSFFRLERV